MNAPRFDNLLRSLPAAASRRRLLTGLKSGLLMGLPLALAIDEAMGKKRKRRKKKRRPGAAKVPPPCRGKPDDAPCEGDGRCLGEVCNHAPQCSGTVGSSCLVDSDCCSGRCGFGGFCVLATVGQRCFVAGDCHSERCVGYRCAQGATADGAQCSSNAQCPFCSSDELCASGQCGCTGCPEACRCTCRRASCAARGAPCEPANAGLDCCEGGCSGIDVRTGQTVCD